MNKALKDFENAKKSEERLEKIYKNLDKNDGMIFKRYLKDEECHLDFERNQKGKHRREKKFLSKDVQKANKALKDAANYFSLAFSIDDKFLFMGDLDKCEIGKVAREVSQKHNKYNVLIAPHHGTHWHDDLTKLSADYVLASEGWSGIKYLKPGFKSISNSVLYTCFYGDIYLPQRRYCGCFAGNRCLCSCPFGNLV